MSILDLRNGDCLEVLKSLDDNSVDSIVTDPPYGLSFMGRKWDYDVPSVDIWRECLRVLKPGGHLLAFAGTRTQHRMCVNIEDAGFEIRDMIAWVYGSGFPKSMDISKAIDKRGGLIPWQKEFAEHLRSIKPAGLRVADVNAHIASGTKSNFWGHFIDTKCQPLLPTVEQYRRLKEILPIDPSWDEQFLPPAEREVVGQKTSGIANAKEQDRYTIGASEAVVVDITVPATDAACQWEGWGTALKPALEPITVARKPFRGTVAQNVLEHGTGGINIDACRVGTDDKLARPFNEASNAVLGKYSRFGNPEEPNGGRWPANLIHDGSDEVVELFPDAKGAVSNGRKGREQATCYSDRGSQEQKPGYADDGSAARFFYCAKASKKDREDGNTHPTVKPTDLMSYLCRLVTPPGGIVLDPFMGSGSTGKAAIREGFGFVGIEREAEYFEIAQQRVKPNALAQLDLLPL